MKWENKPASSGFPPPRRQEPTPRDLLLGSRGRAQQGRVYALHEQKRETGPEGRASSELAA